MNFPPLHDTLFTSDADRYHDRRVVQQLTTQLGVTLSLILHIVLGIAYFFLITRYTTARVPQPLDLVEVSVAAPTEAPADRPLPPITAPSPGPKTDALPPPKSAPPGTGAPGGGTALPGPAPAAADPGTPVVRGGDLPVAPGRGGEGGTGIGPSRGPGVGGTGGGGGGGAGGGGNPPVQEDRFGHFSCMGCHGGPGGMLYPDTPGVVFNARLKPMNAQRTTEEVLKNLTFRIPKNMTEPKLVRLKILFSTEGKPENVEVDTSSGDMEIDNLAKEVAGYFWFTPGVQGTPFGDKPIPYVFRYWIRIYPPGVPTGTPGR